jgi:hypothetical protein
MPQKIDVNTAYTRKAQPRNNHFWPAATTVAVREATAALNAYGTRVRRFSSEPLLLEPRSLKLLSAFGSLKRPANNINLD